MVLTAILIITSIILLVFLESFLLAFLNFRISIILFLFLFRKVEWKTLLFPFVVLLLIFDVVKNFPLGTNLLVFSLVFGLLLLVSLFLSIDSGITAFLVRVFHFALYYVLLLVVPSLLIEGTFGYLSLRDVLISFLKGIVSAFLLLFLDSAYARLRRRGSSSLISIK